MRYRDPMSVVDELELLAKYDFPQINIADDLFTAKKSHCLAICDEILRRKLNIVWSSFARVDTVSPEILAKMKEAGCRTISFGVETANKEILKTIKKRITTEKVLKAIQMCADAGIESHVSFILGLPGETQETLKETQAFGDQIGNMGALYGYHLLAPFPGTAVRDENEKYDLEILTDDWTQYHANQAIVETASVNRHDLNQIADLWEKMAHNHLTEIKEKMAQGEATVEEAWQIDNLDRFLFIYQLMMDSVIEENVSATNGTQATSLEQALADLSLKIYKQMNKTEVETNQFLKYVYDRGGIQFDEANNAVWKWNNYL